MHFGIPTHCTALLRERASPVRWRNGVLAVLALGVSAVALAQAPTVQSPDASAGDAVRIPLFTADPRPSPMGAPTSDRSVRPSSGAPLAMGASVQANGTAPLSPSPMRRPGVEMAAVR
ncbi:hypothetical protein [Pseudacidovorax intermedius]|uniref:hypothetical protein n=1 Tax=Pseudacidovorax intermedius TaxID=433924 RepID=UPI0026F1A7B9|nr:hypothetical protein [Pseudacidovorax intermedius]